MATISEALAVGVKCHQSGQIQRAEQIYREILRVDPSHADSLHLLGVLAHQGGEHQTAVDYIGRAIEKKPGVIDYHSNLGSAYQSLGRLSKAVGSFRRALRIQPNHPCLHYNMGNALKKQGKLDKAIECFQRAVKLDPHYADAHYNLGVALADQENFEEAVSRFRRVLEITPNSHAAYSNLGLALAEQEQFDEATECYRRSLALKPDYPEAHNNWAATCVERDKYAEAVIHCDRALEVNPDHAKAHFNRGTAMAGLERFDEAMASLNRALELDSDYAAAHVSLGSVLAEKGKIDRAMEHFRLGIDLEPGCGAAWYKFAHFKRHNDLAPSMIKQAEKQLNSHKLRPKARSNMHFALGKICDDRQEWDRAFNHFSKANRLAGKQFDERPFLQRVRRLIEAFSASFFVENDVSPRHDQQPIFIVGMPRSGTTLVEQILSSHPKVHGAGELYEMQPISESVSAALATDVCYPDCVTGMNRQTAAQLADRYLARLKQLGGDAERVTDKMPFNYLHLGLVSLILPGAKIIHCRRDPMDVCLSCYFQNFRGDLSFAYDLESLGLYFRHYDRLMEHWRSVLPKPMFEVDYERLVEHQEEVSRELIEFCHLEWDPACLEFHRQDRVVKTASNWQVRQPIYKRSMARWRNYEKHLDPLKRALGESVAIAGA